MQKNRLRLFTLFIAIMGLLTTGSISVFAEETPFQAITRSDGVELRWTLVEPPTISPSGDAVFSAIAGFSTHKVPGQPQVPVAYALIAIPPDANVTLNIDSVRSRTMDVPGTLSPAPKPEGVVRNDAGDVIGGAFAQADAVSFAPDVVQFEEIGVLRGVRLGRVTFFPLRPTDQGWELTSRVTVRINFGGDVGARAGVSNPMLDSVSKAVVNPEHVIPVEKSPIRKAPTGVAPTAFVEVTETGLTEITYEALAAIGFPVDTANPDNFQLERDGLLVAYLLDGDGDSDFEPGERLQFYADPVPSRWSAVDVYELSVGDSPGLRMGVRSGSVPSAYEFGALRVTQVEEENILYTPDCTCGRIPLNRDSDRWVWKRLQRPGGESETFSFSLENVDTAVDGALALWMVSFTDTELDVDHKVAVSLNGISLGDSTWNGRKAVEMALSIPAGTLVAGNNTLTVSLPGFGSTLPEGMWVDAFAITYALPQSVTQAQTIFTGDTTPKAYRLQVDPATPAFIFDVTVPNTPELLINVSNVGGVHTFPDPIVGERTYLIMLGDTPHQPALRMAQPVQTISGADYLVITTHELSPALAPFVTLRESQGLEVHVEHVQAIYDMYGDGRISPEAIKTYLADIYATGSPAPTYVLLVGDGTNDPRGYFAPSTTQVPPFLAHVDPWVGETASDNQYVTVDGADHIPDMLIGRLPVSTLEEASTVISKIINYETNSALGTWNQTLNFVADDTDYAGNFAETSEHLIESYLSDPFQVSRYYYEPPQTDLDTFKMQVKDAWDDGAGLMVYTGHSSVLFWERDNLFNIDDVPELTNGAKLPVVLEFTCFTGSFHDYRFPTLDEALLRHDAGGAVAVWGATGLGVSTGHDQLANGFFSTVFTDKNPELGAAILVGKLDVIAHAPAYDDLVDTFVLLGDPAMKLDFEPQTGAYLYLPLILR